jgi:hypothetical protein
MAVSYPVSVGHQPTNINASIQFGGRSCCMYSLNYVSELHSNVNRVLEAPLPEVWAWVTRLWAVKLLCSTSTRASATRKRMGHALFLVVTSASSLRTAQRRILHQVCGFFLSVHRQFADLIFSAGVYIHHLLTTDRTKKTENFLSGCNNPSRPGQSVSGFGGTGFVGVGEDSGEEPILYTQRNGQSSAGYWVAENDQFMANVVLVNYNKVPKTVYVTYDLEWKEGQPSSNAKGMLISISQCGTPIKVSNAGPTNTTSGKWTFLENGAILAARGHLHGKFNSTFTDSMIG